MPPAALRFEMLKTSAAGRPWLSVAPPEVIVCTGELKVGPKASWTNVPAEPWAKLPACCSVRDQAPPKRICASNAERAVSMRVPASPVV